MNDSTDLNAYDLRESAYSSLLVKLYRFAKLRRLVFSLCKKLEGGYFYSSTLRKLYAEYYGLHIGAYSYGCFNICSFPSGTRIGAYVSIAEGVSCLRRNHPYSRISQHPFFYNKYLGFVSEDSIESNQDNPLIIGNDVWIGKNTIILPGCRKIGNGTIIGAGSVVTKDIPDFAIFAGNPARLIKYRFDEPLKESISLKPWWNLSIQKLIGSGFPFGEEANPEILVQWYKNL